MRLLFRLFATVSGLAILLVLAAPLILYAWGLSTVDGRPQRPVQMASSVEQSRIWKQAGGSEPTVVKKMNPYGFFGRYLDDHYRAPSGEVAAYWIARAYLLEHRREPGMGAWHGGAAALTIWITRNWSTEEILTVAAQTVSADPRAPLTPPKKQE